MVRLTSRFLSYIFHPVLLPFLSIVILFQLPFYINYKYTFDYRQAIYLLIFLNTSILPLLISLFLKYIKVIPTLEMEKGLDRRIPYLLTTIIYVLTFFLLRKINFPTIYLAFFRSVTITLIVLFFFAVIDYKLSAHMAGFGGICGMLSILAIAFSVDTGILLYIFLFIAGVVGSARLYLKVHTPYQVLFGFLLGFAAQMIILL